MSRGADATFHSDVVQQSLIEEWRCRVRNFTYVSAGLGLKPEKGLSGTALKKHWSY